MLKIGRCLNLKRILCYASSNKSFLTSRTWRNVSRNASFELICTCSEKFTRLSIYVMCSVRWRRPAQAQGRRRSKWMCKSLRTSNDCSATMNLKQKNTEKLWENKREIPRILNTNWNVMKCCDFNWRRALHSVSFLFHSIPRDIDPHTTYLIPLLIPMDQRWWVDIQYIFRAISKWYVIRISPTLIGVPCIIVTKYHVIKVDKQTTSTQSTPYTHSVIIDIVRSQKTTN